MVLDGEWLGDTRQIYYVQDHGMANTCNIDNNHQYIIFCMAGKATSSICLLSDKGPTADMGSQCHASMNISDLVTVTKSTKETITSILSNIYCKKKINRGDTNC